MADWDWDFNTTQPQEDYGSSWTGSSNTASTPVDYTSGNTGSSGNSWLSDLFSNVGNKFSNMSAGDMIGLGSALANTYSNLQAAKSARQVQNQNQALQSKLLQSYTDPTSVFNNQYKGVDKLFYDQLLAKAAAQGRTSDLYSIGQQRENNFYNWLNQYRAGLGSSISQAAPSASSTAADAARTQGGVYSGLTNYLAKLFGSQ